MLDPEFLPKPSEAAVAIGSAGPGAWRERLSRRLRQTTRSRRPRAAARGVRLPSSGTGGSSRERHCRSSRSCTSSAGTSGGIAGSAFGAPPRGTAARIRSIVWISLSGASASPARASASLVRPRSARAAELGPSTTAPPFGATLPSTALPSSSATFQTTAFSPAMVGRLPAGGPTRFQKRGLSRRRAARPPSRASASRAAARGASSAPAQPLSAPSAVRARAGGAVGTPVGERRRQAEPAGVRQAGNQRQVGRAESPGLAEILGHPVPPHARSPLRSSRGCGAGCPRSRCMAISHSVAATGPSAWPRGWPCSDRRPGSGALARAFTGGGADGRRRWLMAKASDSAAHARSMTCRRRSASSA